MTDDEIFMHFMFKVKDPEIMACCKELDSVNNLNNDPMAIRTAGHKGMRLAFLAGVRFAESTLNQSNQ